MIFLVAFLAFIYLVVAVAGPDLKRGLLWPFYLRKVFFTPCSNHPPCMFDRDICFGWRGD